MKINTPLLLSAISFKLLTMVMGRKLTVTNNCPFIIWYLHWNNLREFTTNQIYTESVPVPDHPTGWAALPYSFHSFDVPDNWAIGLVWARRECDFETKDPSPHSCLSGGCPGGQLLCEARPLSPVSVAEFALSLDPNRPDHYAISLVYGFNLPMSIDNDAGCNLAQCQIDLGKNCPKPLREPFGSTRFPVGCNSACAANIAPDPNNDPNCCTGRYDTASTCAPSGVQFYSHFKSHCPNTVVYLYDESTDVSTFTCPSAFQANYNVTFCP